MKAILSPSLLSADFAKLGQELSFLEQAGIEWLHLDIMDGCFVPNITFGPPLVKSLRGISKLFFDCHLMVENPDAFLDDFAKAGADLIVLHVETLKHAQRSLARIHDLGLKAGLALNPGTGFSSLRWLLPYVDLVLVMGVNPGFSGQKFLSETIEKVRLFRKFLQKHGFGNLPVQVDGGVSLTNAAELIEAGADILVSGSAFFGQKDYCKAAESFDKVLKISASSLQNGLETASQWRHNASSKG